MANRFNIVAVGINHKSARVVSRDIWDVGPVDSTQGPLSRAPLRGAKLRADRTYQGLLSGQKLTVAAQDNERLSRRMSQMGQYAKSSLRTDVFRFAPNNGRYSAACPRPAARRERPRPLARKSQHA